MSINQQNYQSYTLRLWRSEESSPWRFSLIDVFSGQELHFARLVELIAFLNQHMALLQKPDFPSEITVKS
jgi:hypothetical protein